jgi:hypothetical protein
MDGCGPITSSWYNIYRLANKTTSTDFNLRERETKRIISLWIAKYVCDLCYCKYYTEDWHILAYHNNIHSRV